MAVTDPSTSGWYVMCACGWGMFHRRLIDANAWAARHVEHGAEGVDHAITYEAKGHPIR